MGLHFRKSVKIAPNVRLNFGKKSTSVSIGGKGARITYGKKNKTYSWGIPGTGIYWRKTTPYSPKRSQTHFYTSKEPKRSKIGNTFGGCIYLLFFAACFMLSLFSKAVILNKIVFFIVGLFFWIGSIVFFTAKNTDDNIPYEEKHPSAWIKKPWPFILGLLLLLFSSYHFRMTLIPFYSDELFHNENWLKSISYFTDIILILIGITYVSRAIVGDGNRLSMINELTKYRHEVSKDETDYKEFFNTYLPNILRLIIEKKGNRFIFNKKFIKILEDAYVFADIPALQHIINNMQTSGFLKEIMSATEWQLESQMLCKKYIGEYGTKEDIVNYVIQSFGYGLKKTNTLPKYKL